MSKLTFLVAALDGHGHINACVGVTEPLLKKGHRVVFALEQHWKGKLKIHGFEEEILPGKNGESEQPADRWGDMVEKVAPAFALEPIKVVEGFSNPAMTEMCEIFKDLNDQYKRVIEKYNPDVIIIDSYHYVPSIVTCGKPWINLASASTNTFLRDNLPPPFSGFSYDSDKAEWEKFRSEFKALQKEAWENYNRWVIEKGAPALERVDSFINPSKYANLFMMPLELNYPNQVIPNKWYQFDSFVRTSESTFELPENLKNKPGKLIYLSMGSFGSADSNLMKRLVGILAKSPNRFIVSKGPRSHLYDLPDNMWGDKMVPQTKILPMVDLVINHGGNNTFTECFYYAKPMIVMPLFADQLDNAQRLQETGLGMRLSPHHCTEEELLNGIEKLLHDEALKEKIKAISERIKNSRSQERAAELIESIAYKYNEKKVDKNGF